jgi:hypothetical protein
MNWRRFIRSPRRHALTMKATHSLNRALPFRRDASRYASPAHLYCAFGMAFLRGCYHQILGPRGHLPKFANGLCSHSDVWVHLHPHLIWKATKSYVERGNAFGLISHKGFLTARYRQLTAGNTLQPLYAAGDGPKTYSIRPALPFALATHGGSIHWGHPRRTDTLATLNHFVRSSTKRSCSIKPPQITMALKCAFPAATPKRGP